MDKINICIVKPDDYIHSYAFYELAELIYYSLLEIGIKTNLEFNQIYSETKNIIIGCHLLDPKLIEKIPNSSIILNTEQIYIDEIDWNRNIYQWIEKYQVWDYSKRNIQKMEEIGIKNIKLIKLGYQKELRRISSVKNKDIDVLFYGTINERRKKILNKLEDYGLKVKTLFGVYGKERDNWIERSKVVLNLHAYESQIFEVVRVFYLLTNSVAVVGEVNTNTSIDSMWLEGIYAAKYEELVEACIQVVNNEELRNKIELKGHNSIKKFEQKEFTKEILNL